MPFLPLRFGSQRRGSDMTEFLLHTYLGLAVFGSLLSLMAIGFNG